MKSRRRVNSAVRQLSNFTTVTARGRKLYLLRDWLLGPLHRRRERGISNPRLQLQNHPGAFVGNVRGRDRRPLYGRTEFLGFRCAVRTIAYFGLFSAVPEIIRSLATPRAN